MKNILLFLSLAFFTIERISAQGCTVSQTIPRDTIVCGERISLTAFGQGQGIALLSENFNSGTYGPGWSSSQQAMWNNPCSPNGVDGTTHIWMGNSSPVPRILTTNSFNLSNCINAGVTICFDMIFAEQGNSAPCEGPDEPQEGVYLQYSTNNGATWTTIQYFDPNGGTDPQFINWNNWCFPVPPAALTANTRFRWYQDADSGADYDHWGIDNVVIYCNDPTYNIVWQHDGYSAGPVGGTNPTPVAPRTTTSYVVTMSNGTVTCRDTVTVVVVNPNVIANAGTDTTVCTGQCAQLSSIGKVIQKEAKTPTYRNQETATITGVPGFPGFPPIIPATPGYAFLNMDINITNLNLNTVQNGYITSVCISSLSMFLFGGVELFDIWLVCPSGDSILLVKDSTLTGTTLTNTCFVPAGSNIASASSPYTGSYSPNQNFNNLTGCDANGVWSLHFVAVFNGISLPTGTFNSWSISFNDPEISYTGNFNWSPTTNMTNSNTLTPTVCPPPNSYVLTVSDTAGCVTRRDTINVNVQSCCGLTATITPVQPSCAASNGSITVTPTPAGSYSFLWNDGATTQSRTNLPAGSYCVTITDNNTANCTFDTCIALNSNSTLSVAFSNPVNPTCANNDGSITVTLGGGTAPYNVTVDTGGAPITFPPLPIPLSQTIPGLPAGTVNVTVTDVQGCVATASATLSAPANCCTFTVSAAITQPSCGQNDGSITLTAANGSGNYTYNWSGSLGTANAVSGIGVGSYPVTITDNGWANCFVDTTFSLTNPNGPVVDSFQTTDVSCTGGGSDGGVTVFASSVNGIDNNTGFVWSNTSTDTDNSQNGLAVGAYQFTVTDLAGCSTPGSVTVSLDPGCCFLQTDVTVVPPTCGLNNASVTVNIVTAGTSPYTYSLDGVTFQQQNVFTSVASGSYNVVTLDAALCSDTFAVTVPSSGNNLLVATTPNNITCDGAGDGIVASLVTGGTTPYTYVWNNQQTSATITGLNAGNYAVTVTDASGCSGSSSASIAEPQAVIVNLGNDINVCQGQTVTLNAGNGFTAYLWSTSETTATISPLTTSVYSVTVTDSSGCTASDAVNVTIVPTPVVDLGPDISGYEGDRISLFANVNQGTANGGTYNWQPDTLLSCSDCQNPIAFAYDTITYVAFYTDIFGCTAFDDITLLIAPIGDIFWPNAFTPNNDGNNDIFIPLGTDVRQIEWQMFNRWGEKVFESNNFFYGCDGTYKGQPLPMGVYVYQAEVVMMNGDRKKFKGSVTLIR